MLSEIMAANFNDLMKVTYFQIEKTHLGLRRLMRINSIPRHTVVKYTDGKY